MKKTTAMLCLAFFSAHAYAESTPGEAQEIFQQPNSIECTTPLARVSDQLSFYTGNYNKVLQCRFEKYLSKLLSENGMSLISESLSVNQNLDLAFDLDRVNEPLPGGKPNPYWPSQKLFNTFTVRFNARKADGGEKHLLIRTAYSKEFLDSIFPNEAWKSPNSAGTDILEIEERTLRTLNWIDINAEERALQNRWYRMEILDASTFEPLFKNTILPVLSR